MLGDVPGERRDARGFARVGRITAQHEAIVLHRGAAARRGDQDGVEARGDFRRPGIDIAAGRGERVLLAAQMVDEGAAAALTLCPSPLLRLRPAPLRQWSGVTHIAGQIQKSK